MLLGVEALQKTFPGGVTALDNVSLEVRAGEHVSVVGESGCGKTTLARAIMGLTPLDAGRIVFKGQRLTGARRRDFCRQARMVFQDPFASLDPRFTVRAVLQEALCLEPGMTSGEALTRMRRVLDLAQMPGDILARYPHEFSGGERQRIAIARALMTSPELLILDEAVSSLDVLVQKEIMEVLEDLPRRLPVTYLFISHNMRVVRRISRRVAVMREGRIIECADRDVIFARPADPYTQALIRAAFDYEVQA
jgi:ABC-type glutathione transport system ATPase component